MSFAKGDVVYLKSGSPAMTVRGKNLLLSEETLDVDWFCDRDRFFGNFDPEQLTKNNPFQCEANENKSTNS